MPIKTQHDEQPTLNLTPMIDVVFLLIIFFMVATKFSELERNIDLELPQVAATADSNTPPQPRVVAVFQDGHIELDGRDLSHTQLTRQLAAEVRQRADDVSVIIRGDARCEYQHVATALGSCREAGIADLGITVRVAENKPLRK